MSKPNLFVVAGCNGSGKSTYSKSLLSKDVLPFDADKIKKDIYESFTFDFEFRETMAWNRTQEELKKSIETAIQTKKDFAYETNFNYEPLYWVIKFKQAGYAVHLLFFSLKNTELAIERVAIRFQNGGHYVSDEEVAIRYHDGFNNLNKYFTEFDSLMILESSTQNEKPKTLFLYNNDIAKAETKETLPAYFKRNCPNLAKYISACS